MTNLPQGECLKRYLWALLFIVLALILWPILATLEIVGWFGALADNAIEAIEGSRLPDALSFIRHRITGEHMTSQPSKDESFYRVEEQGRPPDECQCANCKLWTVVFDDGEPTEIGTAYHGDHGKEAAEDLCDLMNMAFDAGRELISRSG